MINTSLNGKGKSLLFFIVAGTMLLFSFIVLDLGSLRTSVLNSGDKKEESEEVITGAPQFHLIPAATGKKLGKSGKFYEFGVIKPGTVLEIEGDLFLDKNENATFSLLSVAGSNFEEADSVPNWINVPTGKTINMDGGEYGISKKITFNLKVPEKLLSGDYSVLVQATLEDYAGMGKSEGAVRVKTASGFMVNFSIAGERIYDMQFDGFGYDARLLDDVGDLDVKINYKNIGNTILTPSYTLNLVTNDGQPLTTSKVLRPCNPKETCSESIIVNEIKGLKQFSRVDVKADLTYTNPSTGNVVTFATLSFTHYIINWSNLVIGLAIFVALLILIFIFRGRKLYLKASCYQYKVQEGDTLENVSKKLKADPKKIIIANDLKSPFFLNYESIILIPKD